MVDTYKIAEMENLLERVQALFKKLEWSGGPFYEYPAKVALNACPGCRHSISEGHNEDECIVKEVLSFDSF